MNAASICLFSGPPRLSDIFGINSTCNTWSTGRNTGASHADQILPDWMLGAKSMGVNVLVALRGEEAGTDTPDENWGGSDDLRAEEKKGVENGHYDGVNGWDTYTNTVMDPYSDRERYMRVTPMVLRGSFQSHELRVRKDS